MHPAALPFSFTFMFATLSQIHSFIHCMTPRRLSMPHFVAALVFAWIPVTPASAEIQHVIAISVDGLRGDFLQTFRRYGAWEFQNFVRLRNSGRIHV
jgi:hypothetical protein